MKKHLIEHSKPTLDTVEYKKILNILKSGQIAQGPQVIKFETDFSRFMSVKDAVAVNCGLSALHLALLALGIGKNDEVIIPSYVCTALFHAVQYVQAKAVIVDVNLHDGNISSGAVKRAITKKTKAIIVAHMFGCPADIQALKKFKIPIIEDCAQAIGAKQQGQLVGGCGTIGVFSFYATKMICAGEGGMVISHNSKLLKFIRDRRDYDHKEDLHVRFNYKMTDLQAGLGITQLKKIKAFIQKRRQIAAFYNKHLNDLDVGLPKTRQGNEHIYFRYVIRLKKNCDRFLKNLQQNGVDARRPVYKPIHMYFKNIYCPQTTELYQKSISIPIYPSLTQKQMHFIVKQLKKNLI